MDTIDRSNSNLPVPFHPPLSHQPGLIPQVPADQGGAPAVQIGPKVILRAISRHWWQILALLLLISAPIDYLVYTYVKPTYFASSTLQIEPAHPDVYNPIRHDADEVRSISYLKTQVNLITSDKILNRAVADPLVVNLPWIKNSLDAVNDLRKNLSVEIMPDTALIRVGLELPDAAEAVTIVQAVVESYREHNRDYSHSANRNLIKKLDKEVNTLNTRIDHKKEELKALVKNGKISVHKPELNTENGADSNQPTFKKVSANQLEQLVAAMVHTDHELFVAQSKLEVKLNSSEARPPEVEQSAPDDKGLLKRIEEEFYNDPDVQNLLDDLKQKQKQLDRAKELARQPHDPARLAAQKAVDELKNEFKSIWEQKYPVIRDRIRGQLTGAAVNSPSTESLAELRRKVLELTKLKEKQAAQFQVMEFEQKETNENTFDATYLTHEINYAMSLMEQLEKNLKQLNFEQEQDYYRVTLVDPAAAPKTPSNNKAIKYMAAAPVGVMFMMVALFLLLEIKAERVGDPDALSTRVRSEVYALPPLPIPRSVRKLSVSDADDQIEQFIQRLDHLRFAVCGAPGEIGKGRCVLITSAIGGEGKTTLAAQLAARCGNAGMSTLLIDSDFRRGSLCRLLDVPEGPGLSDILKDEATIDEVAIPVSGGTFYLLPAGTAISDTSRVLQGPKLGLLMTQLRELYDLIIIDSPPVLPVPDALILGRYADGAVIAARYDISRFPQVERARRQLDNAGIAVLGTVINGMRQSDSYYGRYTYNRRRTNQPDSSSTI